MDSPNPQKGSPREKLPIIGRFANTLREGRKILVGSATALLADGCPLSEVWAGQGYVYHTIGVTAMSPTHTCVGWLTPIMHTRQPDPAMGEFDEY